MQQIKIFRDAAKKVKITNFFGIYRCLYDLFSVIKKVQLLKKFAFKKYPRFLTNDIESGKLTQFPFHFFNLKRFLIQIFQIRSNTKFTVKLKSMLLYK